MAECEAFKWESEIVCVMSVMVIPPKPPMKKLLLDFCSQPKLY